MAFPLLAHAFGGLTVPPNLLDSSVSHSLLGSLVGLAFVLPSQPETAQGVLVEHAPARLPSMCVCPTPQGCSEIIVPAAS